MSAFGSAKEKNKYSIIMIYLIILSGSVLQRTYMAELQKINLFFTILIIGYEILKQKESLFVVKINLLTSFLIVSTIGAAVCMLLWSDFGSVVGYAANLSFVYMSYYIAKKLQFNKFVTVFVSLILVLAIISLAFYYIHFLQNTLPWIKLENQGTIYGGYRFWGIFARYENNRVLSYMRNIGVFWEPGMYQGYLIFAMVLLIQQKNDKWYLVKFFILGFAVLSTGSTTGIILLIPTVVLLFLSFTDGDNLSHYLIVGVLIIGVITLILFAQDLGTLLSLILPRDVVLKLFSDSISRNTRFLSIASDFRIIVAHPFGVATSQLGTIRQSSMLTFGRAFDNSVTNTHLTMFLMYGVIPGLLFLAISVKSTLSMGKKISEGILISLIVIIIMNTEPHYLCLFFTTFLFKSYMANCLIDDPI